MIEKFDGDYAFALLYVIQRYDTHDTFKLIFEQLCMDLNGVNCKTLDGTLLRSCLSVEKPVEARLLLLRAIQRANAQCNDDTVSNNLDIEQLSSWAGLCLHTKKAQV
ncbi:hypothetical protein MP228_007420 [Amoeboaphelidium protococcarum]|nr:hypothetical protein MP228_007420 [Amoeboaphelidium protococcarum]